ncbi:MAG: Hint domain-containing protein [Paracoccaceae bacterium]
MPSIAVWSIPDFGASDLFDLINGTFTISAGATADIAEFSEDVFSSVNFVGNGGKTPETRSKQTLTKDLLVDGVRVARSSDQIYFAAEGIITNNVTGETGRILFVTVNGSSTRDFVGVTTTIQINAGDNVTTSDLTSRATGECKDTATCFAAGSVIKTDAGEVPVEQLQVGDAVWTQDGGFLPVQWIGNESVTKAMLENNPKLAPVKIRKNALGPNLPAQDMSVSRKHRILVTSHVAEMLFGTSEVLVPAFGLTNLPGIDEEIDMDSVEYWHFLLSEHQIIKCNSLETESYLPSRDCAFTRSQVELTTVFPKLFSNPMTFQPTTQPSLTVNETRILTSMMLEIDQFAFANHSTNVSPMHVL